MAAVIYVRPDMSRVEIESIAVGVGYFLELFHGTKDFSNIFSVGSYIRTLRKVLFF